MAIKRCSWEDAGDGRHACAAWLQGQPERAVAIEESYNRRFRGFLSPVYSPAPITIARLDSRRQLGGGH